MDVTSPLQEKVLINSSSVEIGVYFFTPRKAIELTHDFITLPLDKGKETLLLSLSFKHITKVEFLDNSEGEGAGLVLFVNDFMANKIQSYIDRGGNGFANFGLESYANNSNNKIILLDIENKDPKFFDRLHKILHEADAYHRNYLIQLMNKAKNKRIYIPVTFIDVISSSQWKTLNKLLSIARSDFKQQKTNAIDNNNENCINFPQTVSVLPDSGFNAHQRLPSEYHQPMEISPIHHRQHKVQLPAYAVVAMPTQPRTTALVTMEASHNQSPSATLIFPASQPKSTSLDSSKASQTLSIPQFKQSVVREQKVDMLSQFDYDHHQFDDPQQEIPPKKAEVGETIMAQSWSLESPCPSKFLPRSLKVPKSQSTNCNIHNRSAPSFLPLSPCTSQEQHFQLLPQNRTVLRIGTGIAKMGNKREREILHLTDDEENELEAKLPDKRSNDTLFSFPPTGRDNCSVHYADLKYLSRNSMLNDTIIDFYLKYIHHCIVPKERRAKIFIFNTFFFGRLTQPPLGGKSSNTVTLTTKIRRVISNFQKMKNWTKKIDLFNMDYIVLPINEDIHWYLAIIVNVRYGICSLNANAPIVDISSIPKGVSPVPFLIVLNSLIDPAEDKHLSVREQLGEYLHLEYSDKHCQDAKTFFNKQMLEVVMPTMLPQQKNFIDCGLFLLHFAQLFLSNPPKFVSKYSSFRCWYPNFEIKHKRDELRNVIKQLACQVRASDFVQLPTSKPKSKFVGRRTQADKMQMFLDGMALLGRTRRYSDSDLDDIMKDKHFSCLYKPRSLDSLIYENREKPVVLQPPTIVEMSRFKQPRRMKQEIFAHQVSWAGLN